MHEKNINGEWEQIMTTPGFIGKNRKFMFVCHLPEGMDETVTWSVEGEDAGTIEDMYEPFLIQQGFIVRTPKGREATDKAFAHCGITPPERKA